MARVGGVLISRYLFAPGGNLRARLIGRKLAEDYHRRRRKPFMNAPTFNCAGCWKVACRKPISALAVGLYEANIGWRVLMMLRGVYRAIMHNRTTRENDAG